MRFPAPDRLNMRHISLLAAAVFVGQILVGTDFLFAVLTAVYTLLWASAFNVAGGIRYPSGAFIFFNGFISIIVGLGFKVLLGQPGERNLHVPIATMFCYCVGMAGMLVAAFLCRELRHEGGYLSGFDSLAAMKQGTALQPVPFYSLPPTDQVSRAGARHLVLPRLAPLR